MSVVRSSKLTRTPKKVVSSNKVEVVETSSKHKIKLKEDATLFVSRTDAILKKIDAERAQNPITADSDATYEFYRAMLAEMLELIPLAKANYLNYQTQGNIYAFNGLVTKAQELLADLEAISDKGQLVDKIISQLVTPAFIGITATVGNSFINTQAEIMALRLPPDQEKKVLSLVAQMVRNTGSYLQETSNSLTSQIREQFDGD